MMFVRITVVMLCLLSTIAQAATQGGEVPEGKAPFQSRGVYYLDGLVACPLAGIGTRGPKACNRVGLDDNFSSVVIDQAAHKIVLTNAHAYASKQIIGDVLLLASGVTKDGQRAPIAIHLKIEKKGQRFSPRIHAHPTIRQAFVSAEFEPYRVVLSDGTKETEALNPDLALKAVLEPDAMARLAKIFVQVKDNLEGAPPNPRLLADISIGLGVGKLSKMVLRAQLESPNGLPVAHGASQVYELFKSGTWNVRLTSLSRFLPKDVLARELFLFGLDDLPILENVNKAGLKEGESLVFGIREGKGRVELGKASQEFPNAIDKARAFLELSFIGAILEHQAEKAFVAQ